MYGLLFVLPLFLQSVRGEPATRAGIELLPLSATFFVISLIAGKAANAWGPRILISTGMFLTGVGPSTHGVYDFVQRDPANPGKQIPAGSASIKEPTFLERLSIAGHEVRAANIHIEFAFGIWCKWFKPCEAEQCGYFAQSLNENDFLDS